MMTGLHEHDMFFLGSTFQSGFPFPLLVGLGATMCHYKPVFRLYFVRNCGLEAFYFVARGFLQSDHGQAGVEPRILQ